MNSDLFTVISNPSEEDDMPTASTRSLDRPGRAKGGKKSTLVLANGGNDQPEALRIGLSMAGAGITAVGIGTLEGMARAGKVQWYAKLSPGQKATLLLAYFFAAGLLARSRRKHGDYKTACALEAAAIGAFTIAVVVLTQGAFAKEQGAVRGLDELKGLLDGGASKALAKASSKELEQLDELLDDDIRRAATELRRMAEEKAMQADEAAADVGGLVPFGDPDDDNDEYDDLDDLEF